MSFGFSAHANPAARIASYTASLIWQRTLIAARRSWSAFNASIVDWRESSAAATSSTHVWLSRDAQPTRETPAIAPPTCTVLEQFICEKLDA